MFVVDDDFIANDDIMEEGEDIFEAARIPREVGAMAGNDGITALAGEAGAGIVDDAFLESFLHFGFECAEIAFD